MASLILTLVGPDRPGLVSTVSEHVASLGGDWLESRMAHLAGHFAGIVLVNLPDARVAALRDSLAALEADGYRVVVQDGGAEAPGDAVPLRLELVGHDRPGIVRAITAALAGRGVNIEELTTHVQSGSFSGETLFRAEASLRAPPGLDLSDLRHDLESLGNELMVDISVTGAQLVG